MDNSRSDRSTVVEWLTHSAGDHKVPGTNPSQRSLIQLYMLIYKYTASNIQCIYLHICDWQKWLSICIRRNQGHIFIHKKDAYSLTNNINPYNKQKEAFSLDRTTLSVLFGGQRSSLKGKRNILLYTSFMISDHFIYP